MILFGPLRRPRSSTKGPKNATSELTHGPNAGRSAHVRVQQPHMMYGLRSTMRKLRGQENVFNIGLGLLRLDTGELPAEAEAVLIRRDSGARRCLTPSRQALGHACYARTTIMHSGAYCTCKIQLYKISCTRLSSGSREEPYHSHVAICAARSSRGMS